MPHPDSHNPVVRIRALEDRSAIEELKARYARGADAVFGTPGPASATALADLFTDDGVLDLGPFGRFEGRAALLAAFETTLPQGTKWSVHYIVSPLITIDGDAATGHWYYLIQALPAQPGATVIQIFGSYADKYVRCGDAWKIKESLSGFFVPPANP